MITKFKTFLIRILYHERLVLWISGFTVFVFIFSSYIFYGLYANADDIGTRKLQVNFLDVGQGDSIYIRAPDGHSVLIDAGPPDGRVTDRISEVVGAFDKQIDVTIGTHADADHVGGFVSVFSSYTSSLYLDPAFSGGTAVYKNVINSVDKKNIPRITARRGLDIVLDKKDDVVLHILSPDNGFPVYKYNQCEEEKKLNKRKKRKKCEKLLKIDTNETSIVAMLEYGRTKFLFTGDAPTSTEKFLLSQFPESTFRADVLKVGHHGSKYSSGLDFLRAVSPTYAVIPVGKNNRYGHPNEETLERLQSVKVGTQKNETIKVLRTDELETIQCESDGGQVRCCSAR